MAAPAAPAPASVARTPYLQAPADPCLPTSLLPLTVVVVVLVVMALSQLGKLKWVNSERMIQMAQEALQKQNWPAALGAMRKVDAASREQPSFRRVLADYLEETHSSPALLEETLVHLQKTGSLRPEDHLWLCRARLATNHTALARAAWAAIPAPLSHGVEAARLQVELLRREGRIREADQAETALAHYGDDLPSLAVRQCVKEIRQNSFPEVRLKANERLWELAQRQDEAGLDAIRMLSRQEGRTVKEAEKLLRLTERNPQAGLSDRLAMVSLLMRLAPGRKSALIRAEVNRSTKDNAADLTTFVVWLAQEGQAEMLEKLRGRLKLAPRQWFTLKARALAETQQWQLLLDLVSRHSHESISLAELSYWQAMAYMQLHPQDKARPHELLQQSVTRAIEENNTAILAHDARIAEEWLLPALALEAYQALAKPGFPGETAMLENAARIATELKDTDTLAGLSTRLADLQPDNILAARRAAYLRLLRGENLELPASVPGGFAINDSSRWLLAAFQAWRLRDLRSAREALAHITDTLDLGSGARAVFSGLLAKTGETARGFQMAETIHPELLLPEELEFLNAAR